jgi:hypothetical protein
LSASVRVRHNDLLVGARQVGLLVTNARRAQVEDNTVRVVPEIRPLDPFVLLNNARFRNEIRELLLADLRLGTNLNRINRTGPGRLRLMVGNFGVHVRPPEGVPGLREALVAMVGATPAAPVSHRDVLRHTRRRADAVLRGGATGAAEAPIRLWLTRILLLDTTAGAQGIVVGGETAAEVRVLNNTVEAMVQGIHVGLSNQKAAPGRVDSAGRVLVAGNTVAVVLPFGRPRERHGVFVGNCDTLTVEHNYVQLRANPSASSVIDGVRVFGRLGRFVVVRGNHVVGFNPAFKFWPTNTAGGQQANQWLVEDNMAPSTPKLVDVPGAFAGKVRQNNNLA